MVIGLHAGLLFNPASWAAMCHLQRIHLHFWRVDAVMQGAYHCWQYPHVTKLCSTQQHFIIALVFLLVLCCYSPSTAGQRKLILIQKMSFQTQEFAFAFWLAWWGFCSYFTTAWDGSRNLSGCCPLVSVWSFKSLSLFILHLHVCNNNYL